MTFRKAWMEYRFLRSMAEHWGSIDQAEIDWSRAIAIRLFKTERADYARRYFAEPSAFKCSSCGTVVLSAEPVGWFRSRCLGIVRTFCPSCSPVPISAPISASPLALFDLAA